MWRRKRSIRNVFFINDEILEVNIYGYTSYLIPRPETISDEGVEGIIDLANIASYNKNKIEANPELFFEWRWV